jgi:phosphonate transport system substrate-binding protein
MRIGLLSSFILAFLLCSSAFGTSAQPSPREDTKSKAPAKPQQTGERLFFAVSEGASSSIDPLQAVNKYVPLADVLSKAAGQRVVVSLVRSFEKLEQGMKNDEFDLVMARPANYPGRGVRDYGYSLIATAKPDGRCFFVVEKSSLLKKLEDIKGKQIMFPEKGAFMTEFCGAELRDHGIDVKNEPQVRYAREQGAIGWSVENKLIDVGIVASFSPVGKNWEKNGNRILHKTSPQPFFPLVAAKRVPADKIAKMQKALAELSTTDEGKKVLSSLGIDGFNIESKERLMNLLTWLEKS